MKYTIFGESHGPAIGVVLEGVPAGLELDLDFIRAQLRAGEEYAQAIEELAPRYLVERQGRLYLPYPRTECVLHYWKDR